MSYQVTLVWVNERVSYITVEYADGTKQTFR